MGILLLVGGQNALALCIYSPVVSNVTYEPPSTLPAGRHAVGSVLHRSPILVIQLSKTYVKCDGGDPVNGYSYGLVGYLNPMQAVPGMDRVYQTNIPGVGIRVSETRPGRDFVTLEAGVWYHKRTYGRRYNFPDTHNAMADHLFQVELVATGGLVSPGTLRLPSPLAGIYSSNSDHSLVDQVLYARVNVPKTVQLFARSCTVNRNDIPVNLPTIMPISLKFVGATAKNTPFNIDLRCDAYLSVTYQIDGTSPTGMDNLGILANRTNPGDATGVGIQLLGPSSLATTATTAPVRLGTRSAELILTMNERQLVSIPFTARYYRTSSHMTVGAVHARATFTITYE